MYEVDDDVKAKLLLGNVNERAKQLTTRLTRKQLDDYEGLKGFLLREFKISSIQLKERFYTMRKLTDETYTILASRLHNTMTYYLRSRQVKKDFDKLVSLLCADRLKEMIPKGCLDFILAQEKDSWLSHSELANSIDTYMASHNNNGEPLRAGNVMAYNDYRAGGQPNVNSYTKSAKSEGRNEGRTEGQPSKEDAIQKGLCFICFGPGHTARNCKSAKAQGADKKQTRVCAYAINTPLNYATSQPSPRTGEGEESVTERRGEEHHSDPEVREGVIIDTDEKTNGSFIDADEFHVRSYVEVKIDGLADQRALIDGGAEICCINNSLVQHLDLPVSRRIRLSGIQGRTDLVDVVRLHMKPGFNDHEGIVNIAPAVRVWCAAVPDLNEAVILTPTVINLLSEVAKYNVLSVGKVEPDTSIRPEVNVDTHQVAAIDRISDKSNDDHQVHKIAPVGEEDDEVRESREESL